MQDLSNDNGEFADNHGYLGKNHQSRVFSSSKIVAIKMPQFVQVIREHSQLMRIVKKYIKDIDRDCNGYVTNQELDDIFKLVFPNQLGDKDLLRLFRPFASIQNTILIDYKRLYSFLETALASKMQESQKLVTRSLDLTASPRQNKADNIFSTSVKYIPKPQVMLSPDHAFQQLLPYAGSATTRNINMHSRT